MHYLLLSSLTMNIKIVIFSKKLIAQEKIDGIMHKIAFSYFLKDHLLAKGRQPSLYYFSLLQLSKNPTSKGRLTSPYCTYP
jgi:hypothetical protein